MKQYCRYCVYLVTGNGTYCQAHEKELSDSYAKRANNCKDFEFCEMDAFRETSGYKPRNRRSNKKLTCDICKRESTSCNRYLTKDGRTITICPPCLINGDGYLAILARQAHEQGRKI